MAGKRASTDGGDTKPVDGTIPIDGAAGEPIAGTNNAVDPATLGDDDFERDDSGNLVYGSTGKPRRKRGRKSGGSNGATSGSAAKSGARNSPDLARGLETLSQTLLITHIGLARLMDFKEMELSKPEADSLGASIANVLDQFDWTPDPRFTAIAGLVTTASMVYGPRVYFYREKQNKKAAEKKAAKGTPENAAQFQSTDLSNFNLGG